MACDEATAAVSGETGHLSIGHLVAHLLLQHQALRTDRDCEADVGDEQDGELPGDPGCLNGDDDEVRSGGGGLWPVPSLQGLSELTNELFLLFPYVDGWIRALTISRIGSPKGTHNSRGIVSFGVRCATTPHHTTLLA